MCWGGSVEEIDCLTLLEQAPGQGDVPDTNGPQAGMGTLSGVDQGSVHRTPLITLATASANGIAKGVMDAGTFRRNMPTFFAYFDPVQAFRFASN